MGASITKIYKPEKIILQDIEDLNHITENKLFEKRVGMHLKFSFDKKKKRINCILVKFLLNSV